jgi:hypothetical protein
MTNFRIMITPDGKHPPEKWADIMADEILHISSESEETKMKEALAFRNSLVGMLTHHVQHMMDREQRGIKNGRHHPDHPYETEDYAEEVLHKIIDLANGKSFESHFRRPDVKQHLIAVLNRNFKSAMLVERQHFHSEREKAETASTIKKGKK